MSKRAACLQYIKNCHDKLIELDKEMIYLEDELALGPDAITKEGVREVLIGLNGLTWAINQQLKYAIKLEGIPLYATKEP